MGSRSKAGHKPTELDPAFADHVAFACSTATSFRTALKEPFTLIAKGDDRSYESVRSLGRQAAPEGPSTGRHVRPGCSCPGGGRQAVEGMEPSECWPGNHCQGDPLTGRDLPIPMTVSVVRPSLRTVGAIG